MAASRRMDAAFCKAEGVERIEGREPADHLSDSERLERASDVRRSLTGGRANSDPAEDMAAMKEHLGDLGDWAMHYAFGEIWSRPDLSRRDRSLVVIAILCALGQDSELAFHVPAGLNHGLTRAEIEVARAVRADAGLDPDEIAFDAYVNAVCHPDLATARDLIKGAVSIFARFSVMYGTPVGPVSAETEQSLQTLHNAYDMDSHSRNESKQAAMLSPEFIDRFGIVGPPDRCIERFNQLADLGLDKVVIAAQFQLSDTPEDVASRQLMEGDVLPALASAR